MKRLFDVNFHTIDEAAEILSVHHDTIRNRVERGEMKAVRIGRKNYISEKELKNYLGV